MNNPIVFSFKVNCKDDPPPVICFEKGCNKLAVPELGYAERCLIHGREYESELMEKEYLWENEEEEEFCNNLTLLCHQLVEGG